MIEITFTKWEELSCIKDINGIHDMLKQINVLLQKTGGKIEENFFHSRSSLLIDDDDLVHFQIGIVFDSNFTNRFREELRGQENNSPEA
jgi:hypothetical protein